MEHRFVRGYEGIYVVREDGAIFNMKGIRISSWNNKTSSYPRVSLYKQGKKKNLFVHVIVASAFVDNPHPRKYKVVLHTDDNPLNTHKSNLSWGTASMNMKDMIAKGRGKNQFKPKAKEHNYALSLC